MTPTAWTLVPLPHTLNRSWHNRFRGVKDMTQLRTVDDPAVAAVLRQTTRETPVVVPMPPEEPLIFNALMAEMKFDPEQAVKMPQPNRAARRNNNRTTRTLTQRVWDSINPDGTINPDKEVPLNISHTGELPVVIKRGA